MKKASLILFCLVTTTIGFCQSIKGIVNDENKQPIAGALVYFDGSSLGTVTDKDGLFEISVNSTIYNAMVISSAGYDNVSIKNPLENNFYTINMVLKTNPLNEVTVKSKKSRFKRADKLKIFREQFLGTTTAGKSCKILNESDIRLDYDYKKNKLIVTATEPIQIHNKFLGYDVQYRIKECYISFGWTSVSSGAVSGWSFSGTTFFRDLTNDSTSYAATRRMSYKVSQMQFLRNLSRQTLGEDNFTLLHGNIRCNPAEYFTVKERKNDYIVIVKNVKLRPKDDFFQSFILEYPGRPDSEVFFNTKVFKIDKFGNYTSYRNISFSGEVSTKRIGDLLPWDYKPTNF